MYRLALQSQPHLDSMIFGHNKALKRGAGPDEEMPHIVESIIEEAIVPVTKIDPCKMEKACLGGLLLFKPGMSRCLHYSFTTKSYFCLHDLIGHFCLLFVVWYYWVGAKCVISSGIRHDSYVGFLPPTEADTHSNRLVLQAC